MNWFDTLKKSLKFTSRDRQDDSALLYPPFRVKIDLLLKFLRDKGYKPYIYETFRSPTRQYDLYLKKASKLSKGGMHTYGVACDIYFKVPNGNNPCRPLDSPEVHTMRQEADRLGLHWISWDGPHIQAITASREAQGKIIQGVYP